MVSGFEGHWEGFTLKETGATAGVEQTSDITCPAFEQDHSVGGKGGRAGSGGYWGDAGKGMVAGTRVVVAKLVRGDPLLSVL